MGCHDSKYSRLLPIVLLIGGISGCSKDYEKEEIDSDIVVWTQTEEAETIIYAGTEKCYSSGAYGINYDQHISDDHITIKFKNVLNYGVGVAMPCPAYCRINLGGLNSGKGYDLLFKLNGIKTIGTITPGAVPEMNLIEEGNVKL